MSIISNNYELLIAHKSGGRYKSLNINKSKKEINVQCIKM